MEILDARYIADCLISMASSDLDNNDMTNLKLQKLLYYIQGTCLSLHGQKMFQQPIVKWQYGPVVPEVYHKFKHYGNQTITFEEPIDPKFLDANQMDVLKSVFDYFGKFSATTLMNFTHNESPWNSVEMREEITDKLLIEYFDTIVVK